MAGCDKHFSNMSFLGLDREPSYGNRWSGMTREERMNDSIRAWRDQFQRRRDNDEARRRSEEERRRRGW